MGKVSRRQVMMVTVDGEPFRLRFVLYHEDASLEPRILSKARCAPDERPEGPVTRDRRPTVVIVDSGTIGGLIGGSVFKTAPQAPTQEQAPPPVG